MRFAVSHWYRAHVAETDRALARPYSDGMRDALTRVSYSLVRSSGEIVVDGWGSSRQSNGDSSKEG